MTSWKFDIIIFDELPPPTTPMRTRTTCYWTKHKANILLHSTSFREWARRFWWSWRLDEDGVHDVVCLIVEEVVDTSAHQVWFTRIKPVHISGTRALCIRILFCLTFIQHARDKEIVASTELHYKGRVKTPSIQEVPHIKINKH